LGQNVQKTGHVTLTTPIREQSVIESQALGIFCLHIKFGDCRFSHSGDMTASVKIGKNGHVTLTTPLQGWCVILKLGYIFYCVQNLTTPALAAQEISLWTRKFKTGQVTLSMPLLRVIHPTYAGT